MHAIQTFRHERRRAAAAVSKAVRSRIGSGRRSAGPGTLAEAELGAPLPWPARSPVGHAVRPDHRRDPGQLHGQDAARHHRQRLGACTDPALARRHAGAAQGPERPSPRLDPRRRDVDPLARHPAARQHGWGSRLQLRRHQSRRELPVRVRCPPERNLLVPQSFGVPGTGRHVRAADHRPHRSASVLLRSRLRGLPVRLDRHGPGAPVRPAEEAVGVRQLLPAYGGRLLPRRAPGRLERDAKRSRGMGTHAHDADRPVRRQRAYLHLPDKRDHVAGQLDGTFPCR